MAKPDAGYNEPFDDKGEMEDVIYSLEKFEQQYISYGHVYNLYRNDESIGIIRVKSEKEGLWLAGRINGTYKPED